MFLYKEPEKSSFVEQFYVMKYNWENSKRTFMNLKKNLKIRYKEKIKPFEITRVDSRERDEIHHFFYR